MIRLFLVDVNLRQAMTDLLWETKKLFPRGTPYPKFVNDAEDALWGWKMPQPKEK